MKFLILPFMPLLLAGCVVGPPPIIYSWFSITITFVILVGLNIVYIFRKKRNRKEYSLLKMLIISFISMPFLSYTVSGFLDDGLSGCGKEVRPKLTCASMGSIAHAIKLFKLDNGTYPSTKEGLEALVKNPNPKKYPNYASYSYLEKVSSDSWGNPFRYNFYKKDGKEKFEIVSFGGDGKYGGEYEDIVYPNCSKVKKKVGFFEPFD